MAESLKARTRRSLNRLLHSIGLHLAREERIFEMDGLLARAAARGVAIKTWVDVGASDGQWSIGAQRHFPNSRFLLFEPLEEHRPALARLRITNGFHSVIAAAGAVSGNVPFIVDPSLDGSGVAPPGTTGTRSVPVETVDTVIKNIPLTGPFGIKLDTHGYELPVLAGAAETLANANLVIVEAYNYSLTGDSLRFHELCVWMEAKGFRCCDLADPMRRPGDNALWQLDLAFQRASDPLFSSNRYE